MKNTVPSTLKRLKDRNEQLVRQGPTKYQLEYYNQRAAMVNTSNGIFTRHVPTVIRNSSMSPGIARSITVLSPPL